MCNYGLAHLTKVKLICYARTPLQRDSRDLGTMGFKWTCIELKQIFHSYFIYSLYVVMFIKSASFNYYFMKKGMRLKILIA